MSDNDNHKSPALAHSCGGNDRFVEAALLELLEEAVLFRVDDFEADEPVSGADLVAFFGAWRNRVKETIGWNCHLCGPMCICESKTEISTQV